MIAFGLGNGISVTSFLDILIASGPMGTKFGNTSSSTCIRQNITGEVHEV